MPVTVTEKAAKEFKRVIEDQKSSVDETVLRIRVVAGGCHGYEYSLGITKIGEVDQGADTVSEQHGIKVAVDKRSDLHLDGTTLDFYEGLERRGFTFNNPNVSKTCGCGNSFSG